MNYEALHYESRALVTLAQTCTDRAVIHNKEGLKSVGSPPPFLQLEIGVSSEFSKVSDRSV